MAAVESGSKSNRVVEISRSVIFCFELTLLDMFFCSTTLPLTSTWWVGTTINLLHCPLSKQCAVVKSQQHQEIPKNLGNAENWTRDIWVWSANATSVQCQPPEQEAIWKKVRIQLRDQIRIDCESYLLLSKKNLRNRSTWKLIQTDWAKKHWEDLLIVFSLVVLCCSLHQSKPKLFVHGWTAWHSGSIRASYPDVPGSFTATSKNFFMSWSALKKKKKK